MDNEPSDIAPKVWAHLESSLSVYQEEHEGLFSSPEGAEDLTLRDAMNEISAHALEVLTSGKLPRDLEEKLSAFQPGASVEGKTYELLQYNLVQHRIEFDVAWDVVSRLRRLEGRIGTATICFTILLHAHASDTATKYFRKAARLFLAGYESEVAVMCGAVLEAAIASRLDDSLRAAGIRPAHARTGDYSLTQRMIFEEAHPFLDDESRKMFWSVVNWRNDAVHVQPDVAPEPERPLMYTAILLAQILPREVPM